MLQQTQVKTVKPYYRRFVKRFPTVLALAAAGIDDILKCWEHLGYYARAHNLHRAAGVVVDHHGAKIPRTVDELRRLPGIGPYTAAAIASIAFGADAACVDGNVARVLCRVFRVRTNLKATKTVRRLRALADELLPRGKAGDFNQAVMDLGATVCRPVGPDCGACPLRRVCGARAHNEQHDLPKPPPRKKLPHYDVAVGIVHRDRPGRNGRVLVGKRKPGALLGGLWEFPGGKIHPGETAAAATAREVREEVDIEVDVGRRIALVRHAYTHFSVTIHAFECTYRSGRPRAIGCTQCRWVRLAELRKLAIPKASDKILTTLQKNQGRK